MLKEEKQIYQRLIIFGFLATEFRKFLDNIVVISTKIEFSFFRLACLDQRFKWQLFLICQRAQDDNK